MRALLLGLVLATGCNLGSQAPGADAVPPPPDAAPDAVPPEVCRNATPTQSDGHHHPGLNCMAGNCHGPAGDAPQLTVAGTLYKTANGPDPLPYATITIIDANGTKVDLVSSLNGNFYTSAPLVPPFTTLASKCPTLTPMVSPVQYGSCNACHLANTQTGQVYLQ